MNTWKPDAILCPGEFYQKGISVPLLIVRLFCKLKTDDPLNLNIINFMQDGKGRVMKFQPQSLWHINSGNGEEFTELMVILPPEEETVTGIIQVIMVNSGSIDTGTDEEQKAIFIIPMMSIYNFLLVLPKIHDKDIIMNTEKREETSIMTCMNNRNIDILPYGNIGLQWISNYHFLNKTWTEHQEFNVTRTWKYENKCIESNFTFHDSIVPFINERLFFRIEFHNIDGREIIYNETIYNMERLTNKEGSGFKLPFFFSGLS